MWDEPYLETCCRSTLHRLVLCGQAGRPPTGELTVIKDGRCLLRLQALGFASEDADARWRVTPAGRARHASEILHDAPQPTPESSRDGQPG